MSDIKRLDQSPAEKTLFFTKKELNCLYYTENEGDTRQKLFNRKEWLFRSPEMMGLLSIEEAGRRNLNKSSKYDADICANSKC